MAPLVGQIIRESIHTLIGRLLILASQRRIPSWPMMGDLLDHLDEHLLFLSMATLFWYSLNSSYDHEFHLSRWLGMNPKDYEYILVTANLAHFHPAWSFIILVDRLKMFLEGHRCNKSADGTAGSFEVALKKIYLDAYILGSVPKNWKNVHVVCIGQIADCLPKK